MKLLFLVAAVLVLSVIVFAVIDCVKRKPRGRLLWIAFILLGNIGVGSADWSTGEVGAQITPILPLGAAFVRGGEASDAALVVGLPLGALVWFAWSSWRRSNPNPS